MKKRVNNTSLYIRNITFGVEDSLASTVGLLSGVASANVSKTTIIITGVILVFTEALSMGVGSFLTEESVVEYKHKRETNIIPAAIAMFVSYFIAGLLPIAPYIIFEMPYALWFSIAASLIGLSILGICNALIAKTSLIRSARRMLLLGGSVAVAGLVVGDLLKQLTGYVG